MSDMTVRARDRAGLEASAERQGLRAVEAIRAAVGPEFTLQIVVGDRVADEERHRVIGVVIAALEADEHVALVAVADTRRCRRSAGLRALHRENLEDVAQLPVLRAVVVLRFRRGILLPRVHQPDMLAPRAVARLAADAHLRPRRLVLLLVDVVALDDVRAVAVEAVGVPDLADAVRAVRDWRDLFPVHPPLARNVPEHRQHVDAPLGQRRQVSLIALGAERVVDREGFRHAPAERNGHVGLAVLHAERVRRDRDRRTWCPHGNRRRRSLPRSAWSS